jgi:hypothetical protein
MEPYSTDPALQRTLVFLFAVFVAMIAAGVWLARRNFRMGRVDRRGGWKVALFVFSTKLLAGLVSAKHVPVFQGEVRVLYLVMMRALFYAAVIWLFYIALEPYVRRRSPHRLISWTRLLAGDWRGPLVGRDVLVGTLLGIWMRLEGWSAEVAVRWVGVPPDLRAPTPALDTLLGFRGVVMEFVGESPSFSLLHGLGFVFLLFLLSLFLRGDRRTFAGAMAFYLVAMLVQDVHLFGLPFYVLMGAAYIFVGGRFGLLALVVAQFVFFMCEFYPYTTDPSAWYFGVTVFAASVIVALAAYGFRVSLGGRALFRGGLLED